ncbi:MAG TPA: hypothetical protein VM123_02795 [archaeon]|nr:hypothetical protein [archaeon]
MAEEKMRVTIWFLCGIILCVYGLAITGSGVYNFISPPKVVGAELHLDFWWGLLLIGTGVIFLWRQWPGKMEG